MSTDKKKVVKRKKQIIPGEILMNRIWEYQIQRKPLQGETKRDLFECLFLLCWKAGLRISEAINFDLNYEHNSPEMKGLYSLRGKGQKDRWTYLNSDLVKELKKRNWKPGSTTRSGFYEFLISLRNQKELEIPTSIELTPHTLRRVYATGNVLAGMPMPILQKLLGHSKISTTALYVKDAELSNILQFKPKR